MSLRIQALCDLHDEDVEAQTHLVSIDGRELAVDLCEDDYRRLIAPLLRVMDEVGRRVDAAPPPLGKQVKGEFRCPECDKTYNWKSSLRDHLRVKHGVENPSLVQEGRKHACDQPGCTKVYDHPQGLAVHKSKTHGIAGKTAAAAAARAKTAARRAGKAA